MYCIHSIPSNSDQQYDHKNINKDDFKLVPERVNHAVNARILINISQCDDVISQG